MQKTTRKNSAVKLGLAAASALALTLGGVSSAYAADINIGPDEVAGFELGGAGTEEGFNYDQWHIGSNYDPNYALESSVTFGECSVTTLAHPNAGSVVQVLKGFPVSARPSTAEDIKAVFNSTSITILEGGVTIQFPMFEYDLSSDDPTTADFTTVRSEVLPAGTYNLADLTFVDSQGWFTGGPLTLEQFFEGLDYNIADYFAYELLGVGFTGSEGAVVETLSFSGDTYYFGTGDCAPAAPNPTDPTAPTPPKEVQTAAA